LSNSGKTVKIVSHARITPKAKTATRFKNKINIAGYLLYPFCCMIIKIMDIFITIIADWLVFPIVIIGGITMLTIKPSDVRYQMICRGAVAALFALLLAKIGSLFYQGERPFLSAGELPKAAYLDNPGFPSDHTLLVFSITFIVWASTKNKPLSIVLLIMGILVAAGRILALVHSPIDVAGGIVFAFLAVWAVFGNTLFNTKK
jgi:undecaprenyl-diphosphatase